MPRSLWLAALTAIAPAALSAQTELTSLSFEARSYERLTNWAERPNRPAFVEEVIVVPGMIIVDIRATLDIPWSDDLNRISARSGDISLTLPDGSVIESFGEFDYWGKATTSSPGLSVSRPSDYPDEDRHGHYDGLFLVPAGTTSGTFTIGGDEVSFSSPVTIPAPTAPDPISMFGSFTVQNPHLYRRLDLSQGRDSKQVASVMVAPQGYVFADLEIEVTGLLPNKIDNAERFYWFTTDFRLVHPQFGDLPLIGERFSDELLDYQYNSVTVGENAARRVIFLVPEGLPGATLMYGEDPAAAVDFTALTVEEAG